MPVIKSAKKKLRQDKKRQKRNKDVKDYLKEIVKKYRENPTQDMFIKATKATDKAAQKNILHKNKAARLKSSLAKFLGEKNSPTKTPKVTKVKKTNVKKKA